MAPLSIVHVINGGVGIGGAERMIARIVKSADRERFHHAVLAILPCAHLEREMKEADVEFVSLNGQQGGAFLPQLPALLVQIGEVRRMSRVDLIVGWLNHGNMLASLLGPMRGTPVLLNFRSMLENADRPVVRLLRRLAPYAMRRLANSTKAAQQLQRAGFGPMTFIPNGFSAEDFRRDRATGEAFRDKNGIPRDAFVFGHVGRAAVQKNQLGLLRAAQRVVDASERVHVAIVGRGMQGALGPHLRDNPADRRIHLLDEAIALQGVYSGFDAYVHSSDREGFPNVIAEAMLHELPVVCTDAGEARSIVEARNVLVPPGREQMLAEGMLQMFRRPAAELADLGASNRSRVASLYPIDGVVRQFEAHFTATARKR